MIRKHTVSILFFLYSPLCTAFPRYAQESSSSFSTQPRQSLETRYLYRALSNAQKNFPAFPPTSIVWDYNSGKKIVKNNIYRIDDILAVNKNLHIWDLTLSTRIDSDPITQQSLLVARLTHFASAEYIESCVILPDSFNKTSGQSANNEMVKQKIIESNFAYKYLLVTLLSIPCPLENEVLAEHNENTTSDEQSTPTQSKN